MELALLQDYFNMVYLYVVQDIHGNIHNHYWDRKTINGIEQVINQYSTRVISLTDGYSTSKKDAVILNIIEVDK